MGNFSDVRDQRIISVGIMAENEIFFDVFSDGKGIRKVSAADGGILYDGKMYDRLVFESSPCGSDFSEPSFLLKDVTIGINFHWERKVDQTFCGTLEFVVEGDRIWAVNKVGLEDYLLSVISSEMKSTAPLEYLKAHAVISRSWLLAQIRKVHPHKLFDVCADDHCQRYQGYAMAVGDNVRKAILQTWGMVLTYGGEVCDTRFSKCCGGRTEVFSTCWEDEDYPYLRPVEDPFCNTDDKEILSMVLNDYDMETCDFHDWEVRKTPEELGELVSRKTGKDFGEILEMIPLERGASGRIKYLKIIGSRHTEVVGKELAIRRVLSESHLKSSLFDIVREGECFVLKGKGWGHGVGLCQIGAAVMAGRGYDCARILQYYYPDSELKSL